MDAHEHDEIADLADRIGERLRRGEDREFEFAIEWAAFTGEERDEFGIRREVRTASAPGRVEAVARY